MKLLPFEGGVLLNPEVHWIVVEETDTIVQGMPSMTTVIKDEEVSKLDPIMVSRVPPVLGPNEGVILVINDVLVIT